MLKGTKINLNICFKNKLYHGSNSESKNASSEIIQKCPIQCDQAKKKKNVCRIAIINRKIYQNFQTQNSKTKEFSYPISEHLRFLNYKILKPYFLNLKF